MHFWLKLRALVISNPKSRRSRSNSPGFKSRVAQLETLEQRQTFAADGISIDTQRFDTSHVLVQVADSNPALIRNLIQSPSSMEAITSDGWYRVAVAPGQTVASTLQQFTGQSGVLNASPDFRIHVTATPNDPGYASDWGLENSADTDIDAAQAWSYGTTSSTIVAVIDTGIDYNHVDLASNIWTNPNEIANNGIDDDRNGYTDDVRGWNFVSNNNNPMDDNGHGTHVAGTIGAVGNNGIGIAGVAWGIKMMALKFLDSTGAGDLSDAVSAIDYARVKGAKVINASWGGGNFTTALQSAMQRFQSAGGIFVAAAGNESANNDLVPSYPANFAFSNVISVAASTSSGSLASFSNYGANVDIAAPGANIYSTIPGNRYTTYSGTSMASPHVAGAIALLWGQVPTATATQIIDAVLQNTDSVLLNRTAKGRLNVGKAAAALHNGTPPVDQVKPYVTSASWVGTGTSLSAIDVNFSEAMNPASITTSRVQLLGPNGIAITPTSITPLGTTNTLFRIQFAAQSTLGSYTLKLAPTVTDAAGNLLDQDRDGNGGESVQDVFSSTAQIQSLKQYTVKGPIAIADATQFTGRITNIPIVVSDTLTVGDLNIDVSINHTYASDLRLRLRSPDGTWVTLVQRRGGSRDNLQVVFDDEASGSIATASGNLSGTFRPERALSAFDGKAAKGTWVLEVADLAALDAGTLNHVTLKITPATTTSSVSNSDALAAKDVDWLAEIESWQQRFRRRS